MLRMLLEKIRRLPIAFFQRLFRPPLESLPDAPDLFLAYRGFSRHPDLQRSPGGWLYKGNFYPDYLTVGGASHTIFRTALRHCSGKGIDVGAGYWPLPGSIAVDLYRGEGLARSLDDFDDGSLDFVFSSHCLEHIAEWRPALLQWTSKLKAGGIIFLYLPHPSCAIWHPGSPMVGDVHKWIPELETVASCLKELGCDIVASDDGPDAMCSFYICARKSGNG